MKKVWKIFRRTLLERMYFSKIFCTFVAINHISRNMRKTLIYSLWAILLLVVAGVVLIFTAIAKGKIGYVPPIEELENPKLKFATQIISDDGVTMGTYSYSTDNRIYVGYEDLSPHLVNALIATEDERFAEHSGIDARALMRAIVK